MNEDDDAQVTDPTAVGKTLRIEDVINKYSKKSKKAKGAKLATVNQAVIESSAEDASSYSMTTTSDPTGSKSIQNQLTKFMQNEYNISTSNVSASAVGGPPPKAGWREGGQVSAVKESDPDDSSDDDDYSQSINVSGSGPKTQKERFEQLKQKYLN